MANLPAAMRSMLLLCPIDQAYLRRYGRCRMQLGLTILLLVLPLSLGKTEADAPLQEAAQEIRSIRSSLGWRDCNCATVLLPKHTDEVADIVLALYRDQQASGQKYLIRATSQEFTSHNDLSCACESNPADVRPIVMDMSAMDKILEFNDEQETITVQTGITFEALERTLLEYGTSLAGVVVAPQFGTMTLGAAILTSAHGSSLVGPATIAQFLHSALLVDGTGDIQVLDNPGQILEGSLGMFGVVTEVVLYVQKRKKMAVRQIQSEDFDLVADLRDIIDNSEAMALDVTWNPTAGMYQARVWHETDEASSGDARNVQLQQPVDWLMELPERVYRDQIDLLDREGHMCEVIGELSHMPYFVHSEGNEPDESTPPDTAIGWLNQLTSASCGGTARVAPVPDLCLTSSAKLTPHELAINSQDFSSWLADARAVLRHVLGCPPFVVNFRFVGESDSPLALSSGRQVVAIEMSTLSSHRGYHEGLHVKFSRIHDELLQMTMCKYGGRPSWAYASNRLLRGAPCAVRDLYGESFGRFLELRASYDPAALFLPQLFRDIIDRRGPVHYPGCAVRQDCFCITDTHCGPNHECVRGQEFPQFRVCAPRSDNSKFEL